MKTILYFSILLFSSVSSFGQKQKLPVGKYMSQENGLSIYLDVNEDDSYRISMLKGKMVSEDSVVKLEIDKPDVPVFGLIYETGNVENDSILIHFSDGFKTYNTDKIFYSTSTNKAAGDDYQSVSSRFRKKIFMLEKLLILKYQEISIYI